MDGFGQISENFFVLVILRDFRPGGSQSLQIFNSPEEIARALWGCLDDLRGSILLLLPDAKQKLWI